MLAQGQGTESQRQQKLSTGISEAANQGYAKAQYNLALMYGGGIGVPQDDEEAFKWHRLAAEQGYARAQFNMGLFYINGLGVPQDFKAAEKCFQLAAKQSYAKANYQLGKTSRLWSWEQRLNELEAAKQYSQGSGGRLC